MALADLSPDNPIEQAVLKTFMQRKKISYAVASNGQEAVEKWGTGNYHLVLVILEEGFIGTSLTMLADGYSDAHNGWNSGNKRD
jgi:CheY-like chemotaxis protein